MSARQLSIIGENRCSAVLYLVAYLSVFHTFYHSLALFLILASIIILYEYLKQSSNANTKVLGLVMQNEITKLNYQNVVGYFQAISNLLNLVFKLSIFFFFYFLWGLSIKVDQ